MPDAPGASALLRRAATLYDSSQSLADSAVSAAHGSFNSAGKWMQSVIESLRAGSLPGSHLSLNRIGVIKYLSAASAPLVCIAVAIARKTLWPLLLCVPLFYVIEVQMLFVFPLALDGSTRPFRDSRQLMLRAGGTLTAMRIVIPLALFMLFAGFLGRGFLRCWCLGCIAVCIWYESLIRFPKPVNPPPRHTTVIPIDYVTSPQPRPVKNAVIRM